MMVLDKRAGCFYAIANQWRQNSCLYAVGDLQLEELMAERKKWF